MMKLRNLMQVACMATAALTAFSCSQEEFENSGRKGNITVNATFEGAGTDTRTTVNDEYKILWQDTDALGLFCSNAESNYSNTKLEYASGAGQTSATFNGSKPSGETAVFSIYPYQQNMSVSGNTLTMTLPATLTNYNGSSNGPMYAKVTNPDNLSALSFKHMAAMIKLTVNKIPAEATTFKIIASNNIAGTCTVDLTAADPILAVTSDESKEITASFTASADIKSRNFYIPLPTGTYSSITAQLTNGSDKVYFTKTLNDKILGRRDILVVPPLDCVVVEATTPSALSTALADSKNLPQEAPTAATVTDIAVSGSFNTTSGSNDGIAIPVLQNSDINLAFNTAPTTSTAAPLTLTDKTNTSVSAPAATATLSGVERLQAHAAAQQLRLEHVEDRLHALLGDGLHLDRLAGPRDPRVGVLEVEALRDLLGRLVQGVVRLLPVDLGDDVERRISHAVQSTHLSPARHLGCGAGVRCS